MRCNPLDHFGHKSIHDLFFQHLTADVYTSGAGRGNPQLGGLFIGVVFETINQTELLNGSQSNAGQDAEVRDDRQNTPQAKPGAFGCSQLHSTADDAVREIIKNTDIDGIDALKAVDRNAIGGAKLEEKLVGIYLHRFVCVLKAAPQTIFDPAP